MKCIFAGIVFLAFLIPATTVAQHASFEPLDSTAAEGCTLTRHDKTLYVEVMTAGESGQVSIPRFAAPLSSIAWRDAVADAKTLSIMPEQEHWVIKYTERPAGATAIEILFDAPALLIDETEPVKATADGSIYLPAHLATIVGENVRYEPQTFKNTVGYWTGKQDQARWHFEVQRPGEFNVGILQGCGKGHGGSSGLIEVTQGNEPAGAIKIDELEFEVRETGHFQNFQWRHLGTLHIEKSGQYTLRIVPKKIANAALMDVRAINLVRLPDAN